MSLSSAQSEGRPNPQTSNTHARTQEAVATQRTKKAHSVCCTLYNTPLGFYFSFPLFFFFFFSLGRTTPPLALLHPLSLLRFLLLLLLLFLLLTDLSPPLRSPLSSLLSHSPPSAPPSLSAASHPSVPPFLPLPAPSFLPSSYPPPRPLLPSAYLLSPAHSPCNGRKRLFPKGHRPYHPPIQGLHLHHRHLNLLHRSPAQREARHPRTPRGVNPSRLLWTGPEG